MSMETNNPADEADAVRVGESVRMTIDLPGDVYLALSRRAIEPGVSRVGILRGLVREMENDQALAARVLTRTRRPRPRRTTPAAPSPAPQATQAGSPSPGAAATGWTL